MKAQLKKIHSPDICDLEGYKPEGKFCFFVQFIVGPHDGPGEESIDSMVKSHDVCNKERENRLLIENRYVIMDTYDYFLLKDVVSKFIGSFEENNWNDLMKRLSVLGSWEFENYQKK